MSKHGKHAAIRAVKSLPVWLRTILAGLTAIGLGGGIMVASGAGADVSSSVFQVSNGQAGYVTFGGRFEHIYSHVYLRQTALNQQADLGQQLCDPNTGDAVQVGVVPATGGFLPEWATGQLSGTSVSACAGDGLLAQSDIQQLPGASVIPVGHTVAFTITYSRHGNGYNSIHVEVRDLTANTFVADWNASCNVAIGGQVADSNSCGLTSAWPQFRTAGIGVETDPTNLSAPDVNVLERPTNASVQMYNSATGNLGGGFWTAQPVDTVVSGTPLVVASGLANGGNTFQVNAGSAVSSQPAALGHGSYSVIGD